MRTPPPGREILLRPDRVWDAVADAPTEGLSVLLRDGRVAAVAHGLAPGPDTDVLDMPGCTLLPGFIDCHVHLLDESAETGPAAYQTLTAVPVLRTLLHNGFTTVRDLGSAHLPLNVSLRDAVEDGLVEGPRILAAPNILSPPGGHGDKKPDLAQRYGHRIGTLAQGVEGLRSAIREQARAGADWIKFAGGGGFSSPVDSPTSTSYSRVEMHTIVATADDLGLPCAAHVFTDRAVLRAVAAGVRSVEHGCFATPPTYRAMEQAGTFLVPTQYVQTYFLDLLDDDAFWDDSSAVMRESYREHAEALREGLLRPARTDVKTAFGTDAGMFPHADNWREFPTLMGNGYTALRALRAATSVAADLLGRPDLGTLTPGAVADLVALEGDPFRDMTAVARVRHVIQRGRPVVREPATIAPGARPVPVHPSSSTPPKENPVRPEQLVEAMKPDVERFVSGNRLVELAQSGQIRPEHFRRLLLAEYQCQEAELSTYALLVARHRHEIPATMFSFIQHTIATARGLLREASPSVGVSGPDIPPVPVDQGLFRVVRDLTWMGTQAGPAEAALYLHTDLSTWCTLFSRIVDASRQLPDAPHPVLTYMESWGERPPPEVAEGALEVLAYGLAQGEEPARILHTARQLGALVDPYWDYVEAG
ncbi:MULTISPECIES: metal-dependent hydrolase family protein [Streptomyces]|uniref:metal-dependent hydrolase family protein n=1 Tax=Streptomyces TaxID=1883 RepID=UPI000890C84A|nr:amidohydrolase family protein [Streptomyces sp. LaPpAH-199]MYW79654.1 amidohydrolase family protein [Streptomyces sp. SID8369]SDD50494.1 Imidazolonepropionase [Streptomyces sp. LaPpAH-199]